MTDEEMVRNARCLNTMLPEFASRYLEAARSGRVRLWAAAVRSVIDMVEFDSHDAASEPSKRAMPDQEDLA